MHSTLVPPASPVFSLADSRHYVACRLERLLTLPALGVPLDDYAEGLRRRQVELLGCLTSPGDERFTYDLRLCSNPDPALYTRGRITIALLCRIDEASAEEAVEHGHSLLHLIESRFPEYEFVLADAAEVERLLDPFPVVHAVAVVRRVTCEPLSTLRRAPRRPRRVGFTSEPEPAEEQAGASVFHVAPFVPTGAPFEPLFHLLLRQVHPVAVSCRLRPTTLAPVEAAFLEGQIAACERYAQATLEAVLPEDLSVLEPALREQARVYQHFLHRMLLGVRDDAALMTIQVASPAPVPDLLADAVGALVTAPTGGIVPSFPDTTAPYLAGGHEVLDLPGVAAAEAFRTLDVLLPPLGEDVSREGGGEGVPERLPHLFDAVEAAAAFRLPASPLEPPLGVDVRAWRERPAPASLPTSGTLLGVSLDRSSAREVRITAEDRMRHVYAVGQTGTGKTTLLKTMVLDDLRSGRGLCLVDPHGDLFREVLALVPEERVEDVVLLDPTDVEYPVGLNLLEYDTQEQRHFLVQEFTGILTRLLQDEWGAKAASEWTGPIFLQHMRMNLLLVMSNPEDPGTLLEFHRISQEKDYWRRWLPLRVRDPLLERWVEEVLPRTNYLSTNNDGVSMGGYIGSKFEGFVFDPMLRNLFGQKRSTIDLREVMDTGKVLLVNLAKGELTEANARFLGMVLLAKLQAAAMGRGRVPRAQRRDFFVYVDEFQSLATQNFTTLLSEGRKFRLGLVLANQFVSQLKQTGIAEAILGNVGTIASFRLGQADAELMEREMFPVFNRHDLLNLPNWHAYVSTLVEGQTVHPFTMDTVLDPTHPDPTTADRVRAHSRTRYARPRVEVEEEIARSLAPRPDAGDAGPFASLFDTLERE